MWKCTKCGEQIENDFEVCWNCGTGKDGSPPPDQQVFEEQKRTLETKVQGKQKRTKKILKLVSFSAVLSIVVLLIIVGCPTNVEILQDKHDIKGLIKALGYESKWGWGTRTGSWKVPRDAAEALVWEGESAVEPLIDALLLDKNSDVRRMAAWILGEILGEDSRAALAFGWIGDSRAVVPLTKALKDENEDVREAAKEALEKMGYRISY